MNQSMNSPNIYNQITQETQTSKADDFNSTTVMESY